MPVPMYHFRCFLVGRVEHMEGRRLKGCVQDVRYVMKHYDGTRPPRTEF